MGFLRSGHLFGVLVPLPDLSDFEQANDGATNNSSYTEASARPGVAVADDELTTLVPVISGAQDGDLILRVEQGGSPGITGDACQVGYRYATEAVTQQRGWAACNGFDDWDNLTWTTSAISDFFDAVVHPDDQRVLVCHANTSAGTTLSKRWEPDTAAWTTATTLSAAASDSTAMCALPTGRVLCLPYGGPMQRSDNFGTTWQVHSGTSMPQLDNARMVEIEGEILLVGLAVGTSNLLQYASSDGGNSFTLVETVTALGTKLSLCKLPDGRIVLTYRRNADGFPCARRIGSPWDPISDASVVVIDAASHIDIVACSDDDGIMWAYGTLTAAAVGLYCWISVNFGETWGLFTFGAATVSTSSLDSLRPLKAVSVQGQVMLLCKFVASTGTNDPSIVSLRFGGWSNAPYDTIGTTTGIRERIGFGPHPTLTPILFVPIELPNNNGWTGIGAGTGTLTAGRLNLATVAQARSYTWGPGTNLSQLVRIGMKVNSGGVLTARDVGLTVEVANGATAYRLDIRFTTTGFRVFDPHNGAGVTIIDVSYTTTAEFDVMVFVTSAAASSYVLYKRPYEAAWTVAASSITLSADGTPAATGLVEFGHISSGTADSNWRYCAACETGVTSFPGADRVGRPISTIPVPLHAEVADSVRVGRISAIGGSGALAETFTCAAEYDYPGDAIYPQVSPSPSAKWRTNNRNEQRRAWLFDYAQPLGEVHPGIIAIGCNFRLAELQYESGGWTTICSLDLAQGFAGINYVRTGSSLLAGAGGVVPARFLAKDALKGGYAVIETGGGAGVVAKRIAGNEPGWWSSSTDRKQARVWLENINGTEDANGQCDLVFPSGVAINYQTTLITATRWRIRITATQTIVDDYYEAGILVPAGLHVPGAPPDWGYSEELVPNVSARRSAYGTSFVRQLGPPIRNLILGWARGGANLRELRASATDGDYLGLASQLPFAAFEDVPWWAEAMQVLVRSGEIPMVAIKSLPLADTTLNDASLLHYGRLDSSVGFDHELGNEDSGELVRPIAWTIAGIP